MVILSIFLRILKNFVLARLSPFAFEFLRRFIYSSLKKIMNSVKAETRGKDKGRIIVMTLNRNF